MEKSNIRTSLLLLNRLVLLSLLFWTLLLPTTLKAQLDNNWVFGYGCGVNFKDSATYATASMSIAHSSTLSDSNGSLLLYYTEKNIRNSNDSVIDNGDSLWNFVNGYNHSPIVSFGENILVVNNYLYETQNCPYYYCSNIVFSIIRKTPEGFILTNKNTRIVTEPIDIRFAVIRHGNGIDWWLLTHEIYKGIGYPATNSFYSFLLSKDTIKGPYIQNINPLHNNTNNWFGDAAVSKLGDKVAFSTMRLGQINLYDFDRCTGMLSNHKLIQGSTTNRYNCLEFSPSGRYLYVTTGRGEDENALYQLDLTAANIQTSAVKLWQDNNIDTIKAGAMKLAPDGKIYMTCHILDTFNTYHNKLGVIHSPDSLATACDFRPFDFELTPNCRTSHGLPHIPNYSLGALPVYIADAGRDTFYCAGDSTIKGVSIGGDTIPGVTYQWQLGPGIDEATSPNHIVKPLQSRWYYVTITDTNYIGPSCNSRLDSVYVEVRMCVGINEVGKLKAKVYPNPSDGKLTVILPDGQNGNFSLLNLLGQEVFDAIIQGAQATFDLGLPTGVYIYHIEQDGKMVNGKLVVE